ncbi:MAG: metal ABC transporter permease [Verrucomicrobia bacterium]|nr:metal ABC transporter permease [Verrucomicrobiota bacterium]MBU1734264.1 metal ABC transporter permease [Verrucomicrobiota bacterium]MBU1855857.1 metal ABC transporter permease [Verrucomicrobiota bacterium]
MTFLYSIIAYLPFEWAQFAFMQNALLAVLLIAPLFALIGCLVISNQMAFFSDAIGHAALTGIAIGTLAGLADPLWAMLAFATVLAILVSVLRRYSSASTDTIIGLMMAFAVALGVVLLSRGGGFARYSRYLIGDLLTITPFEILRLVLLLAIVTGVWLTFFNPLFFTCLNRSLAKARGFPVWRLETLFAVIVALVVTMTISWVGLLVINALLIVPAAASRNMARTMTVYVLGAVVISALAGILGLITSFYWGTATGATIVLFAMGFFILSLAFRRR